MSLDDQYDEAMADFTIGDYTAAIEKLKAVLAQDPAYFDALLSLGMAYCRQGDYASAIAEGHKAAQLRPDEQLVHTNLSVFYLKAGDKDKAEQHSAKAKVASWKTTLAESATSKAGSGLDGTKPPTPPPLKSSEMPWKKTMGD